MPTMDARTPLSLITLIVWHPITNSNRSEKVSLLRCSGFVGR